MYSVVIKVFCENTFRWSTITDSTSRSGATRKALGILRQALIMKDAIQSKSRLDNYEYWTVKD